MKKEMVPKRAGSANGEQKENKEKNPNAAFIMPAIQVFSLAQHEGFLTICRFLQELILSL